MNVYFDTGLLLKLYSNEANSPQAVAFIQGFDHPITFGELQQAELRNALYRKCARNELTSENLKETLKDIQKDLDSGILQIPEIDWREAWALANQLTAKYVLATQCRTLDVLHVAIASQLGVKLFATTDQRQLGLARKAGLKTATLS